MSIDGMRIGKYVVERRLPRTGVAEAYLAVQSGGEQVVVKVYPQGLQVDAPRVERFAQMLSMLDSPVIAVMYEAGVWNGRFFTVTRYLPGGTLAERLRTRGKLPLGQAASILYTLATGLSSLHTASMYHLNIKPENVLFDADNAPLLTDFSIARFARYTPEDSLALNTQDIRYLSPEQLWDVGGTGAHSDIYALGALYYVMLTGQPPHGPQRELEALVPHLTGGMPALDAVPRPAQRVLQRTLAPQPDKRFPTVDDLAASLERALPADVPTKTAPAARPATRPRFSAGLLRAVGIALLFTLALALGVAAALWQRGPLPLPGGEPTQVQVAAITQPSPTSPPSPSPSPVPSKTPVILAPFTSPVPFAAPAVALPHRAARRRGTNGYPCRGDWRGG